MIDFSKGQGLVPVIIQHYQTLEVLMLGYMNQEAWEKTLEEKKVTFFPDPKTGFGQKGKKAEIT